MTAYSGELLVEGIDDQWVSIHVTERHGVTWDRGKTGVRVTPAGDVSRLLLTAPVAAKSFARLGIVVDADVDVAARWASLRDRLAAENVVLPTTPTPGGTVVPGVLPGSSVGVWLMPDNAATGILEDFLSVLIPAGDALWPHAISSTDTARALGASFSDVATMKAKISAWLAWREEPGLPFGTAVKARYFDANVELAQSFADWFKRVFAQT